MSQGQIFPVRRAAGQGRAPRVLLNSPGWERPRFAQAAPGTPRRAAAEPGPRWVGQEGARGRPRQVPPGGKATVRSRPSRVPGSAGVGTARGLGSRGRPAGVRSVPRSYLRWQVPPRGSAGVPDCRVASRERLPGPRRAGEPSGASSQAPPAPSACDLRGRPRSAERARGVAQVWARIKSPSAAACQLSGCGQIPEHLDRPALSSLKWGLKVVIPVKPFHNPGSSPGQASSFKYSSVLRLAAA